MKGKGFSKKDNDDGPKTYCVTLPKVKKGDTRGISRKQVLDVLEELPKDHNGWVTIIFRG